VLRAATADRHHLTTVRSAARFGVVLQRRPFDLAFVDPHHAGLASVVAPVLARYPLLPVVMYTRLSPETPREALRLAVRHLVLAGVDDTPAALVHLIDALTASPIAEGMLAAMAPGLSRLSPAVRLAVERLVRGGDPVTTVDAFRRLTGQSRTSLHRALARAGLPSPRTLVRAARIVRALTYVAGGPARVAAVARRLGYNAPRRFSTDFSAVTGYTPSRMPRTMPAAALVARVMTVVEDGTATARAMGRVGIEPTSVRL
jgi:AraC-like DNA-binding protein